MQEQAAAFQRINFTLLTRPGTGIDADDPKHNVSHFFLQYAVNTTDFFEKTLVYPSRFAELWMRAEETKLEFVDAVRCLGDARERARPLLETVTFGMLARKVDNWQVGMPSVFAEAVEAAANIDKLHEI